MKNTNLYLGLVAVALMAAGANASDVTFTGKSAQYVNSLLAARSEGVVRSSKKSLTGRPISVLTLDAGLLECQDKDNRILKNSIKCALPGTDSSDIAGTKVISLGGDDLNDSLAGLQNAVNLSKTLKIRGVSASRTYAKLQKLVGTEKSITQNSGVTSILKNQYATIAIDEISCQKTARKILGGYSYACIVFNVTVSDSNAPTTVLDAPKSAASGN